LRTKQGYAVTTVAMALSLGALPVLKVTVEVRSTGETSCAAIRETIKSDTITCRRCISEVSIFTINIFDLQLPMHDL